MNYKELYKEYSKKYDNAKENAKNRGESFADEDKLSREAFKASFAQKKVQIEEVLKRKVSEKEVVKEIINEQKFGGTLAQTKALRDAMKKQGYNITWSEIRKWGGVDANDVTNEKVQSFWWDVQQERKAFLLQHPNATSAEVSKYIAITMFGS